MIVTEYAQLKELVDAYLEFDALVFDVETRGKNPLDPRTNEVFWISLAGPGRADVIPMGHPLGDITHYEAALTKTGRISLAANATPVPQFAPPPTQLWPEEVFGGLEVLFNSDRLKINHNIKFDITSLAKYYGGLMQPPFASTDVMAHLLNENHTGFKPYSLGSCCHRELHFLWDKGMGKLVETLPFTIAARYSYFDAKYTWLLYQHYLAQIEEHGFGDLWKLECDVTEVVCHMEHNGVPIDVPAIKKVDESFQQELEETFDLIYEAAGFDIDLNKQNDIRRLVYEVRKHKPKMWTEKTNEPSTAAAALEIYAKTDEVVAAVIHWASLHKMHATFVNGIMEKLIEGRVHGGFNQRGARTGRFSSDGPNLQNIPTRQTKVIRDMFIAPPGMKMIVADYSQIELRLLAHYCEDPMLVKAYLEGINLHTLTAQRGFRTKEPTELQYSYAKNTNFTLVYGGSAETIADRYKVPLKDATLLYDAFYATYRRVDPWRKSIVARCKKNRVSADYAEWTGKKQSPPYVETITGRRRRLPEIFWSDRRDRTYAERQAVSHVIQGTAGDINKYALVNVLRYIKEEVKLWEIILTIHDEIVTLVPEAEADHAAATIKTLMEDLPLPIPLRVPLVVDVKICNKWSEK